MKLALTCLLLATSALAADVPNPILFVTQVPMPGDFTTIGSTFGNHSGAIDSVPRGGDLWIRYPDGTLKNLTRAAGFGTEGMQTTNAIAVRDPAVHWSGTKALFSMVVGAPPRQFEWGTFYWQIYEITGLGKTDTPVIRKIDGQPVDFNNISPIYGTDDRILFTTDRSRNGARHLYPQLDEYEEAATVTGIWSLDPQSGDLRLLNHTPSGAFTPLIDSFGRVIFTRWDHLQRDQQADTDALDGNTYGTFDFADENANAAKLAQKTEIFPEPRAARPDLLAGTNLEGNSINHFFPWEMNEDGTSEETLNHVGRHELHSYFNRSINDDNTVVEFISTQQNTQNFFQIEEDPTRPGRFFGVDAPEFGSHASGHVVSLLAEPERPADSMTVTRVTPIGDASHYREPLPLANGTLLVVHASETRDDANDGTRANPQSRYAFRIEGLDGTKLTNGITASVTWWDPDVLVTWSGTLWELNPVEVRARTRPVSRRTLLEEPEASVFREEGVDVEAFKRDLVAKNLAIIVSRDVTARDAADKQQPFNLRVANGTASHVASNGKVYDIANMQFYQADQVRGLGGTQSPKAGRRVLARVMHDASPATVKIAADGSVAAFVPANRALSWQTTNASGTPVVRERYWLTFQPGEVRVCAACHGVNTRDQLGKPTPQNAPLALRTLLQVWKRTASGKRRSVKK
ncbi:MAG TPA: hypothetical protein VMU84_17675 [Thermoanaerobaculia bacterium]|nr:hypothetical protein [Thermoanaerobaculia bacterium]